MSIMWFFAKCNVLILVIVMAIIDIANGGVAMPVWVSLIVIAICILKIWVDWPRGKQGDQQ